MTQNACLLCRVVSGELQVEKIIESENIIGVMNTAEPLSKGHAVFFSKRHASNFHDMDDRDLAEILLCIRTVARAMELANYNILQNNGALATQTVFHAHFHLIPKWSESDGLRYDRTILKDIDQREVARKVKEALSRNT